MFKKYRMFILCLFMGLLMAWPAWAGYNELTVATDGEGILVYTSASGKKRAGLLYNGYRTSLSLRPDNGLYACDLTSDLTVWLDQDKAMKDYPRDAQGLLDTRAWVDAIDQRASGLFLAEVCQADAPLYTSTDHETLSAKHAPGTLLKICGEFGSDYFVDMGAISGFIPKSAVAFYSLLPADGKSIVRGNNFLRDPFDFAAQECTVYTGGAELALGYAATGYCDMRPTYVKDGDTVWVLRVLGDWAQLSNQAFIETRFLDPEGDHSIRYATVKSSKVLNRLNVRYEADEDSAVMVKLCSGAKVQVPSRTEEWASVFITGEKGGERITGSAMTDYLVFDETPVPDGCVRVRLNRTTYGGISSGVDQPRIEAGTELTVIGVNEGFDPVMNNGDHFLCLTDEGRLIYIGSEEGVLEPIDPPNLMAKVKSNVRFREKPDQESKSLRMLKAKAKVKVLLRGEGWTMIEYKGQIGYVMSRYLTFP